MVPEWQSVIAVSLKSAVATALSTGEIVHVHVHAKHNVHRGNIPDIVSYPGTVALLNGQSWNTSVQKTWMPPPSALSRMAV